MGAGAIDLEKVQAELNTARAKSGEATAITSTMNFIVYIGDQGFYEGALKKARRLSEKHPARVFILNAHRAPQASVAASSLKVGEASEAEAERIELGIAELTPEVVCSLVNTLRIPGIPDVLWWTASPVCEPALFKELTERIDTIIVDSSGTQQGESAIQELTRFCERESTVTIRDLAYLRLAPWQDMVAQFFDDSDFVSELRCISTLEITAGSSAEALYLVGWLASRLGWTPCGRDALCDADGRSIDVTIKREGQMRRVLRVAIATKARTFSAELGDSSDTVCLEISDVPAFKRCAPLLHVDNMSLLEKSFLAPASDRVFDDALRVIYQLLKFAK